HPCRPARYADAHDVGYPAEGDADAHPEEGVPDDGRQPCIVVRFARVGSRAAEEPHRRGLRDLLAAESHLVPLMRRALTLAAVAVVAAGCSADRDTRRFRVPSSSMEPTLHCARPGFGCEGTKMDLVAVH